MEQGEGCERERGRGGDMKGKRKSVSGPRGGREAGTPLGAQRLMDDLLVSLLGAVCVNDSGEKSSKKKRNEPTP